jgi:Uma2 family endonuclease
MAVRPSKLTYDDLVNFPDDGLRRELIDGEVFVTPAANTRHQRLVGRLHRLLANHFESRGGGEVFVAPYDVVLSLTDVVEPDLVVVAGADVGLVTEANIKGAPTLAVEVVSDPRHDRVRKHKLYASFGTPALSHRTS